MACDYWKNCGVRGGGCCSLNLYGGKPSLGVCRQCPRNTDPSWTATVGQHSGGAVERVNVVHGALGLGKWLLRMDRVERDTAVARLKICAACEHRRAVIRGIVATCGVCGCALRSKVASQNEHCPVGKW